VGPAGSDREAYGPAQVPWRVPTIDSVGCAGDARSGRRLADGGRPRRGHRDRLRACGPWR